MDRVLLNIWGFRRPLSVADCRCSAAVVSPHTLWDVHPLTPTAENVVHVGPRFTCSGPQRPLCGLSRVSPYSLCGLVGGAWGYPATAVGFPDCVGSSPGFYFTHQTLPHRGHRHPGLPCLFGELPPLQLGSDAELPGSDCPSINVAAPALVAGVWRDTPFVHFRFQPVCSLYFRCISCKPRRVDCCFVFIRAHLHVV